jgi:ribosomal protein L7/L12
MTDIMSVGGSSSPRTNGSSHGHNLDLTDIGPAKSAVVNVVRSVLGIGYKAAADYVHAVERGEPRVLGTSDDPNVREFVAKLRVAGATVKANAGTVPSVDSEMSAELDRIFSAVPFETTPKPRHSRAARRSAMRLLGEAVDRNPKLRKQLFKALGALAFNNLFVS